MKVYLDKDEWYPVYSASLDKDTAYPEYVFDVPEETFSRWSRIQDQFEEIQKEMARLVEEKA